MQENDKGLIELEGVIMEVLPNAEFRIQLDNGHTLTAYSSGKIRKQKRRILLGDRVKVEVSPHGLDIGRIVYDPSTRAPGGARRRQHRR